MGERVRRITRRGYTLLEMVVVLVLLGIVVSVVAPALLPPNTSARSGLGAVLENARRTAVLRGEPVTLMVDVTGRWRVENDAPRSAGAIASGVLDGAEVSPALQVHISAVGVCVPVSGDASPARLELDATTCKVGRTEHAP